MWLRIIRQIGLQLLLPCLGLLGFLPCYWIAVDYALAWFALLSACLVLLPLLPCPALLLPCLGLLCILLCLVLLQVCW